MTDLAEVKTEKGEEGFTVFTVSDETWLENIPQGNGNTQVNLLDITKVLVVDPLELDPVLQRLVVATQLVLGPLDLTAPSTIKTVGGRTIIIKIREDGQLVANDVCVKMVAGEGKNRLCVLEKLLFIRPEDVEIGVERARGAAK